LVVRVNDEKLQRFLRDEDAALAGLRRFVGGQAGERLDGSAESLAMLDEFIENLTRNPNWESDPVFEGIGIRSWLTVRLAYYFGLFLRKEYGAAWRLGANPDFGTPVVKIGDIEISPLEIASEHLAGAVDGGLSGVARDLRAMAAS
jgi:hypothetical protein